MKTLSFRVTDQLRWEGTSEAHLVQPSCSSKATYNQVPKITYRWLLIISKDGDTLHQQLPEPAVTNKVGKAVLLLQGVVVA